jgi:hypothetical protein
MRRASDRASLQHRLHTVGSHRRDLAFRTKRGRFRKGTYQFEEFSFLKEQNGVEVVLLDLPELLLERREAFPSG